MRHLVVMRWLWQFSVLGCMAISLARAEQPNSVSRGIESAWLPTGVLAQQGFTQPGLLAPPRVTLPPTAAQPPVVVPQNSVPPAPGAPPPALAQSVAATVPGDARLTLEPRRYVAAVGSQVTMVANLSTAAGKQIPSTRINWQLSQQSAGQFVADQPVRTSLLGGPAPKLVDPHNAYGDTLKEPVVLGAGGASAVSILSGQSWVGVTSAVEGISQIRASVPGMPGPANYVEAMLFWIDTQWTLPSQASAALGAKQPLTTLVRRKSNGQPLAGWKVRYELIAGPEAGFGPANAKSVEVTTDDQGRGIAELNAPTLAGASDIRVSVFQPPRIEVAGGEALMIGTGVARITWSDAAARPVTPPAMPPTATPAATGLTSAPAAQPLSPQTSTQPFGTTGTAAAGAGLAGSSLPAQQFPQASGGLAVLVRGPDQATAGSTAEYTIDVENKSAAPVDRVALNFATPSGASVADTQPQGNSKEGQVSWEIGQLAGNEKRSFKVTLNVEQPGPTSTLKAQAELFAGDVRTASHSRSTLVRGAQLDVKVTPPSNVTVGGRAKFIIEVSNRGELPATNLVLTDSYDDGLLHDDPSATGRIQNNKFGTLDKGQSKTIELSFNVEKQGTLCHTVEVTGDSGLRRTVKSCITVRDTATIGPALIGLTKTGPTQLRVGETGTYLLEVTNYSNQPFPKLTLSERYDLRLPPKRATDDAVVADGELRWTIVNLQPGESKKRKIECEAVTASPRLCTQTTATVAGLPAKQVTTCVVIVGEGAAETPAAPGVPSTPSKLALSVTERDNPIRVGHDTIYYITVTNKGTTSDKDVAVKVDVPLEAAILSVKGNVREQIRGRTVNFAPVAGIGPGETLTFEVTVKVQQPGSARIHAEVTSHGLSAPVLIEKVTTYLPVN